MRDRQRAVKRPPDGDERQRAAHDRLERALADLVHARAADNRLRTAETKTAREKALVELRLAGTSAERELRRAFGL